MTERITLEIPDPLLQQARDAAYESGRSFESILQEWLEHGAEAEWEASILDDALGDALDSDGNIDFDRLRQRGLPLTLDKQGEDFRAK